MTAGYLMILPALVLFAIFFVYSLVQAFHYSLLDWNGVGSSTFIGLSNYQELFADGIFWQSFLNNWYYALGIIVFGVIPGMVLAYLLSGPSLKGRAIFRSIYFLPRIISAVVYGTVWVWIFDPRRGLLQKILDLFGGKSIAVLGDVRIAMLGITITGGWTYFGFCMVIFLAAFMGIDYALQESAVIDGASRFQIFWKINLPQIKPVINMLIIYTIIDSFKVYDLVLVMTGGGPNNATKIMTYYIYQQAFEFNRYGYGSAAAITLGVFMVIFTILYNKFAEKED
jgi:raffinose/stachyose/melibiose transport system permease protein